MRRLDESVSVYPHGRIIGDAVITADIAAPVNAHLELHVRNRAGIGFGCYGFMAHGRSVKIVDGWPQTTSLAESDIAVIGPGGPHDPTPGYGCWGENFDPNATSYRLVFRNGGRRNDDGNSSDPFVKQLPNAAVDGHQLDVRASDGRTYRLHLHGGAGVYFTGWLEASDGPAAP